jgi:hypothetical protein
VNIISRLRLRAASALVARYPHRDEAGSRTRSQRANAKPFEFVSESEAAVEATSGLGVVLSRFRPEGVMPCVPCG